MQEVRFSNRNVEIAANVYFPQEFDQSKKYPVVFCNHPVGGVKEQTSGLYAKKIAALGYITLALDAAHQGESSGEPRYLEDPHQRVSDFSAAIDYLNTLDYVDSDRIAILGICGAGGYVANAAIIDHRIKAVIGISAVNIGDMFRKGWYGTGADNTEEQLESLKLVAIELTKKARGEKSRMLPWSPLKSDDTDIPDLVDAWEYYRTERASHPNAISQGLFSSIASLMSYDAFNFAEKYLTQPLLMIAGEKAGSLWNSENLLSKSASVEKELFVIKGAGHIDLYDKSEYVEQAIDKIENFLNHNL